MTIEQALKEKIISEYGSLKNFVDHTTLKYSTVDSILKRGVMNSNVQNIIEICKVLNISTDELSRGKIVPLAESAIDKESFDVAQLLRLYKYQMAISKNATLDNKPLTKSEEDFISDGIEILIEQLRKKRKVK